MSDPRYILAKYVPNLGRMEPRNIGVFLWHKGRFQARFLEPSDATFVKSRGNFNRWVQYWNELIKGEHIEVPGEEPIPRKSEACLDALVKSQKGEYLLVDGGFVPSKLSVKDMPKAVSYLFNELVAYPDSTDKRAARRNLKDRCGHVLRRTGVVERADFHKRYPVRCSVYGVSRHLHFHYGLGNGSPVALLQRVTLSHEPSVNSSALMFHALTDTATLAKDRCAALIQGSDIAGETAEEGRALLSQLCQVIDVEHESDAAEQIDSLAV